MTVISVSRLILSISGLLVMSGSMVSCAKWDDYQRFKTAKQIQANTNQKAFLLKQQTTSELVQELIDDSKAGVEPFNSSAYRSIQNKPQYKERNASIAKELTNYFSQAPPNRDSFLGLLALRKVDESAYRSLSSQFRTQVLVDTLEKSRRFNAWGLPHLYWQEASTVLIEEGDAAIPYLVPLLDATQQASVAGSELFLESQRYQYRLCDYALGMISEITPKSDRTFLPVTSKDIPIDPKERDQIIKQLKKQFQRSDDRRSTGSSLGTSR